MSAWALAGVRAVIVSGMAAASDSATVTEETPPEASVARTTRLWLPAASAPRSSAVSNAPLAPMETGLATPPSNA